VVALPVGVTIVGGFLGSGKTTLLNHLLTQDHGLKVAVIVNEFGSVGIDGTALAGPQEFVSLDNGCLCCALNADLERTARALMSRGGFSHVVVETTGVADPLPVAWAFAREGMARFYRLDAIVTVVDAQHFARARCQYVEVELQARRADILLVNKTDLAAFDEVRPALAALNPSAVILPCQFGRVAWDVLLGGVADHTPRAVSRGPCHGATAPNLAATLPQRAVLEAAAGFAPGSEDNEAAPEDSPRPGHAAGLAPGQGAPTMLPGYGEQHTPFETWAYESNATFDEIMLETLLESLPTSVYRAKGILRTDAEWAWTLVNVVAGRVDMRPFDAGESPRGALVFIGVDLDAAELEDALSRAISSPT
jgi:G3E family GTPase